MIGSLNTPPVRFASQSPLKRGHIRATAIRGVSCTNDILGNRTALGTTTYGWDTFNRMISLNANSYVYRADGMRVQKTVGAVTTRLLPPPSRSSGLAQAGRR